MSIGIRNFGLKQASIPLQVGDQTLTIEFEGIVDQANENDVMVTATIDNNVPIIFKVTGNKQISFRQTFPVGNVGLCSKALTVNVQQSSSAGAAAQISMVYTTVQGKKRNRFPTIIF